MTTLEELHEEHHTVRVGPKMRALLYEHVVAAFRNRDPFVYSGSHNPSDAYDDVLHGFIIDVLLGPEEQLAYIMSQAVDVGDFHRLSQHQLRRYLSRSRQRSVVDNLLERAVALLSDDSYVVCRGESPKEIFVGADPAGDSAPPSEEQIFTASTMALNLVPRIYSETKERRPKVYTDQRLLLVTRLFLGETACSVGRNELRNLFEFLLTPWATTILELDESDNPILATQVAPEDESIVKATLLSITEEWTESEYVAYRYKLSGLPDRKLAERLGVSRPTAANVKDRVMADILQHIHGIESHIQIAMLEELSARSGGIVT